jgi:hypothetical protein
MDNDLIRIAEDILKDFKQQYPCANRALMEGKTLRDVFIAFELKYRVDLADMTTDEAKKVEEYLCIR